MEKSNETVTCTDGSTCELIPVPTSYDPDNCVRLMTNGINQGTMIGKDARGKWMKVPDLEKYKEKYSNYR